ncbi:phosphopantetheine-binding protein [Streptomyces sp. JJ38]|uniref:phosphopantetheine-binding protein n=1 Tax=Streptomyces sp. JJ38 TaxID=2738128 RepID=UPI001C59A172|nr:phosphopantetheine-binding protein [Streptomyces sp. JJ38]MBW1597480.1 phosphopantetheine attachment domain protein [Streptomyces sp. JJ38]
MNERVEAVTPASFRADLAELLHQSPDEVDLSEGPVDAGLDSLRISTLAERWRAAGVEVGYVDLAERGTFQEWWELLAARMGRTVPDGR